MTVPIDGQDEIFKLAKGYYTTKALLALWRLGVLERGAAGEDLELAAIADRLGVGEPAELRPIFDYLIVRGYLDKTGQDVYRLSERGTAASPYFGYLSTMVGAYEPVFSRIEDLLCGRLKYGRDVKRSHEEMVRGLTSLEDRMMGTVTEVVRTSGARKVLDLGCGSARMLAHICAGGVRGVGVDRDPNSCAVARETVLREGLQDRVTIIEGDAAEVASLPREVVAGVDMITVMFLLHEILRQRGRAGTVRLLREIADLLGEGGSLAMVEVSGTVDHMYRENQLFVPEYELLHEYTAQRLAAREEWEAMAVEAGMKVLDVLPVDMCQAFCLVATPIGGAPR
ncbi:class I SAM-dependent methyltransferase [Nonomuraea sp. NPDC050783]|uniref:class I SAM-dependent methyltransferase n=1 Tax=Nonomuraea sp. NPDC050783 TaxID=3154634 RepID=UPI003465067E